MPEKKLPQHNREPQVFDVKRSKGGWRFDRRTFLAAATAAAAAATVGTRNTSAGEADVELASDPQSLRVVGVEPGDTFGITWLLRNVSGKAWGKDASITLYGGRGETPLEIPLPAVGDGETVPVTTTLAAPAGPGDHQIDALLRAGEGWADRRFRLPVTIAEPDAPGDEQVSPVVNLESIDKGDNVYLPLVAYGWWQDGTPTITPTPKTPTPTRTLTPTRTRTPTRTPTATRTPCSSHCSHCSCTCTSNHYWYPN